MQKVEGKLADWHQLHKRAEEARQRLAAVGNGPDRELLEEEVRRLTRDADEAIAAVHAALATARKSSPAGAHDGRRQDRSS